MKDMNKKQQDKLKQLFEELGNEAVPESGDPWHALQQRLSLQNPRQRQRQKGEQLEMPSQSQPEPIAVNTGYDPASRALRRPRRSRNMTILAGLTLVIVGVTAFIAFLALGVGAPAPGFNPSTGSGSPPLSSVVPAVNVTATPGPTETPPPTPTTLPGTTTSVPLPETTSVSVTPLPVASPTSTSQSLPPTPQPNSGTVTATATTTAATTRQPNSPSTAPLTSTTKPAMTPTRTPTATVTTTPDFNRTALALLNGSDWRMLPNGTGTLEQNRRFLIAYQPSTVKITSEVYTNPGGYTLARAVAIVQQDSAGKPFIAFTADQTANQARTSKACLTNIPPSAALVVKATMYDPSHAQYPVPVQLDLGATDAAGTPLIQGYGIYWETKVQDYRLKAGPSYIAELRPEYCK
jgi:hypothetical protein